MIHISKIKFLLTFFALFMIVVSRAQDIVYPINEIPVNLLKNSKAVVRDMDLRLEILSDKKAIVKYKKAVTILNDNGIRNSYFVEFYDKFRKIKNLSGIVYNSEGKKVKTLKGDDIIDFTAISGYSVYEDNRLKAINPEYRAFPFTVEYIYEMELNTLLQLPEWIVYEDYNVSVKSSSFTVKTPKGYKLRYLEQNYPGTVLKDSDEQSLIYSWQIKDKESVEEFSNSRILQIENTIVYIAPNDFITEEYRGNAETWSNFGKWVYDLNVGRNLLNDATKSKIDELIKSANSDLEKVKIMYEYMQSKTRYVSIQMGVGSWQPFSAEEVDRLGYGDCKALTNYMKSLLDYVGIRSLYTIVLAGEDAPEILQNFPSNQFNHAFLCVPFQTDTIWIECTSQTIPCGYIGKFTDDRKVLLIDSTGGELVDSKSYTADENQIYRMSKISFLNDVYANAQINTEFIGLAYDNVVGIMTADQERKKKMVLEGINIPSFELLDFKFSENKEVVPVIFETLDLQLNNYTSKLGDGKYIFKPALFYQNSKIPKIGKNRKSNIFIRRDYIENDSTDFILPDGYGIQLIPDKFELNSEFGEYRVTYTIKGNCLKYNRYYKANKGDYSFTKVNEYIKFITDIYNNDNKTLIIYKIQ